MIHGKGYDGKNISHCYRLLEMAIEIGEGKGIIVRRQNREFLLSIRRGEMDYDQLIEGANLLIEKMDKVFSDSNLPDKIDSSLINDLLLSMRKERYFDTMVRYIEEKQNNEILLHLPDNKYP
jgi:hypothetical protein